VGSGLLDGTGEGMGDAVGWSSIGARDDGGESEGGAEIEEGDCVGDNEVLNRTV